VRPRLAEPGKVPLCRVNAPAARQRTAAECRANAEVCEAVAGELRELVAALDTSRVVLGHAAGGRQRQRLSTSADVFERVAEHDREWAAALESGRWP
jgi:hypothetical protein